MRPQPTIRVALRGALAVGRGQSQSCTSRTAAVASFPQSIAAYSSRAGSLKLRATSTTATTATAPTQQSSFFSTSTSRPDAAAAPSNSSSVSSSSSAPSSSPAPILPASVLSQILFAPCTSPSSPLPSVSNATSVTTNHPSVYATVQIHGRPYLVTPGDSLRLPFKMPGVQPGDELLLNRVGVVGNRNVTAVSSVPQTEEGSFDVAHVPGVTVKAVVLGVETEPLRVMIKKKRRTRRKRSVKSKHHFTVLRIQQVSLEEQ
ncbi:hypothetical protein SCUCBS95973_006572 [Sporothrix curviconia]|uniref:Large ribosomal subunit protein bL21m n=1 Tax=Sporothrix curviconia TaxID=1260050 RepID=A0ABP0C693_9PEZI